MMVERAVPLAVGPPEAAAAPQAAAPPAVAAASAVAPLETAAPQSAARVGAATPAPRMAVRAARTRRVTMSPFLDSVRLLEPRYALLVEPDSDAAGVLRSVFAAGDMEFRATGNYVADGTTLTTTPTCGGSNVGSTEFTATSTTLMLFSTNTGSCGPGVFLYTRE